MPAIMNAPLRVKVDKLLDLESIAMTLAAAKLAQLTGLPVKIIFALGSGQKVGNA